MILMVANIWQRSSVGLSDFDQGWRSCTRMSTSCWQMCNGIHLPGAFNPFNPPGFALDNDNIIYHRIKMIYDDDPSSRFASASLSLLSAECRKNLWPARLISLWTAGFRYVITAVTQPMQNEPGSWGKTRMGHLMGHLILEAVAGLDMMSNGPFIYVCIYIYII